MCNVFLKGILYFTYFLYSSFLDASLLLTINKDEPFGVLVCYKEHSSLGEIEFSIVKDIENMSLTKPECLVLGHPEHEKTTPDYALVTIPEKQVVILQQLETANPIPTSSIGRYLTIRDSRRNTWNFDTATCYQGLIKGIVIHNVSFCNIKKIEVTFNQMSAPFDEKDFSSQQQMVSHKLYTSDKEFTVSACKEDDHLQLNLSEEKTSDNRIMMLLLNFKFHCAKPCWYFPEPQCYITSIGPIIVTPSPVFRFSQSIYQMQPHDFYDDAIESELESEALVCGKEKTLKVKLLGNGKVPECYQKFESEQGLKVISIFERTPEKIKVAFMGKVDKEALLDDISIKSTAEGFQVKVSQLMNLNRNRKPFLYQDKYLKIQSQQPTSFSTNELINVPVLSDYQWLEVFLKKL
ncbi:hypothetical protein [Endozoicomonas sp. Mp262]|uniref:hypothetical protein n=1 Tax=Endozoicomonas sp. Mp262 TaxID=2919499 RepID=UPI0021D9D4E2